MKDDPTYGLSYLEKCRRHGYSTNHIISRAVLMPPSGAEVRPRLMQPVSIRAPRIRKRGAQ